VKTAKANNQPLTGDYEFYPNETPQQKSEGKSMGIKTKTKRKIAKSLCPCTQGEMEYTGQTADDKNVGVYRCKKHLTWKRFPNKKGEK